MRSVNARVVFASERDAREHKNVKIVFELGWIMLEDQHGDRAIYPAHAVLWIDAKPTSYDRGN